MTILTVYLITTVITGGFLITLSVNKDPDIKTNVRDFYWWLAIVVMSLMWPLVVWQFVKRIIDICIYSDGGGL